MNKEIGVRIAQARKAKGMTAVELAEKTGFSGGRISHWEQGRRLPNLDSILVLQKALETPATYLLCLEDEMNTAFSNMASKIIPLSKITAVHHLDKQESLAISLPNSLDYQQLLAIKLVDDSMQSLFRKDDIIIVNKQKKLIDGCYVLFTIKKTGQTLFRKFSIDNTDLSNPVFKLIPLNSAYEMITSPTIDYFLILGVFNDDLRLFL